MQSDIIDFYSINPDVTWSRHDTVARLEGSVLWRVLMEVLPPAPARIADVGGANGRWAYALTDAGYSVCLSDVTPPLVADAKNRADGRRPLERYDVADAQKLPYDSCSFDAALVCGPMYGLRMAEERVTALQEIARILKPSGTAVLQYFTRVSGLRGLLTYEPATADCFDWRRFLATGVFSEAHIPELFRIHAWATEAQAVGEIERSGLSVERVQGMDGPAAGIGEDNLAEAPEHIVQQWVEIALEVGRDASLRSTADHLLIIANRGCHELPERS